MSLRERFIRGLGTSRRMVADYKRTFHEAPHSQRTLAHILDGCEITRSTVRYDNTGRVDVEGTFLAEGRRQIGLAILDMLGMTEMDVRELESRQADQGDGGD